jgi:hypothetical protein
MLMMMFEITMAHEMRTSAKQANFGMSSHDGLRVRLTSISVKRGPPSAGEWMQTSKVPASPDRRVRRHA